MEQRGGAWEGEVWQFIIENPRPTVVQHWVKSHSTQKSALSMRKTKHNNSVSVCHNHTVDLSLSKPISDKTSVPKHGRQ